MVEGGGPRGLTRDSRTRVSRPVLFVMLGPYTAQDAWRRGGAGRMEVGRRGAHGGGAVRREPDRQRRLDDVEPGELHEVHPDIVDAPPFADVIATAPPDRGRGDWTLRKGRRDTSVFSSVAGPPLRLVGPRLSEVRTVVYDLFPVRSLLLVPGVLSVRSPAPGQRLGAEARTETRGWRHTATTSRNMRKK